MSHSAARRRMKWLSLLSLILSLYSTLTVVEFLTAFAQASASCPLFAPYWGSNEIISNMVVEESAVYSVPLTPKMIGSPHSDGSALGKDLDDGSDSMEGMDVIAEDGEDGVAPICKDCDTVASIVGETDPRTTPCLLIPEVLLQLLARGKWSRLILCIRWHGILRSDMDRRRCRLQGPSLFRTLLVLLAPARSIFVRLGEAGSRFSYAWGL